MFRDYFTLSINGKVHKFSGAWAFAPLSDLLRYEKGLTGTKVVCAEGDCGACTVMHARLIASQKEMGAFVGLNSCIASSILLDGCHLITVEGLGTPENLSEIQQSMVRNFGGQCGFCTPGFVMSITNMYEQKQKPTEQNVKNYLTGNLCRCTGYAPIIKAALDVDTKKINPLATLHNYKTLSLELAKDLTTSVFIRFEEKEFFAPTTLEMAIDYKKKNPDARIFSGATDLGVQINKGKSAGTHLMSLHLISDLYEVKKTDNKNGLTQISVGARVTLDRLQKHLHNDIPEVSEFLNIFASPQIKNTATLVGNLANGSPIADTTPFLMALDSEVELVGPKGVRQLPVADFFKAYKTFSMEKDEFITRIIMNVPKAENIMGIYKISQRRDLDISCLNSCYLTQVQDGKFLNPRIAYGGVGPVPLRLWDVEKYLEGKKISAEVIEKAQSMIVDSISPITDPRGTKEFRQTLAKNLFRRFAEDKLSL